MTNKPETPNAPSMSSMDRLPCRGCPATCPHYASCDGKPWRMPADVVNSKPALSTTH